MGITEATAHMLVVTLEAVRMGTHITTIVIQETTTLIPIVIRQETLLHICEITMDQAIDHPVTTQVIAITMALVTARITTIQDWGRIIGHPVTIPASAPTTDQIMAQAMALTIIIPALALTTGGQDEYKTVKLMSDNYSSITLGELIKDEKTFEPLGEYRS